jgi:hypothetical protein
MSTSLFAQKKDWTNTFEPAFLLVADLCIKLTTIRLFLNQHF